MTIGIIAFATSEPYRAMACEMAKSARAFAHPIKLRFPGHLWDCSWADAVCWKPQFILDELCDTSLEGLIYTDADSKVLRRPPVEDLAGCDFGYVPWHHTGGESEVLTGTMFFRKCDRVIRLLEKWVEVTPVYKDDFTPEQKSLRHLFPIELAGINVRVLGPEWCWIYDADVERLRGAAPVFEHHQASRKYRHARAEA